MVKGDIFDYFGLSGYTNDELKKMGYVVWMPVQEKGSWLGEGDNPTFMNSSTTDCMLTNMVHLVVGVVSR
jgi:hypothetical protein